MKSEKQFYKFIKEAKQGAVLNDEEKKTMRLLVMDFMKQHPLKSGDVLVGKNHQLAVFSFWRNFVSRGPMMRYASLIAMFAITIIGFNGISFAAQSTLPGDLLYPVKVNVSEEIFGMMMLSHKNKAKYDVYLTQLRLEELEKAASQDNLDSAAIAKVSPLLDKHIKSAQNHSVGIKGDEGAKFSANIHSELEASLNAHGRILDSLANKKNNNSDKKDTVKSVVSDLRNKNIELIKKREDGEEKLSKQPSNDTKVLAENTLTIAQADVAQLNKFIEGKKSKLNANSYANIEEIITIVKEAIAQGQNELILGNYTQAFSLFQRAIRMAEEIKINIVAEINLKVDLYPVIKINNNVNTNDALNTLNSI